MGELLLNEKFRPDTLEGFIGHDEFKDTLRSQIKNNDIQNYTFYGNAGSGKTTLAKIIVNMLDCDYEYINASDERGIETIRGKIKGFASSMSTKPLKVIILDEADYLLINAQTSLRSVIETYSTNTRFILTCNYIERIIDPLLSRCKPINIKPPGKGSVYQRVSEILKTENIKFETNPLVDIINDTYPDIRQTLNTVQFNISEGILKTTKSFEIKSSYQEKVMEELRSDKPDIRTIRQIIQDSDVSDFDSLLKSLYYKADKYSPKNLGTIAIIVHDYYHKSLSKIDKEINIMACISEIIKNVK
jgi:replication factor C small subunit